MIKSDKKTRITWINKMQEVVESRECAHLERTRHIKVVKRKDLKKQNGMIKKGELEQKLRRAIIANALNDHGRKKMKDWLFNLSAFGAF